MSAVIVMRRTNVRGIPVGEDAPGCLYADDVVEEARSLRQAGATFRAIALALGPNPATVYKWCSGRLRRPPARTVVKVIRQRATDSKSSENTSATSTYDCVRNPARIDTLGGPT